MARTNTFLLGLLLASPLLSTARIHNLHIKNDNRFAFSIEAFAFSNGGTLNLSVSNLAVSAEPAGDNGYRMGFAIFPTSSESNVNELIQTLVMKQECIFDIDFKEKNLPVITWEMPADKEEWTTPEKMKEDITAEGSGSFDLFFTNCDPVGAKVSFVLDYTFMNPGGHYLSAGEIPLPAVYGVVTALFAVAFGVWIWYSRRNRAEIQKIHHLMTLLVAVKFLSVMTESIMYHFIDVTGHSTGWNVVFYILTFVRGTLLIVVIALIGAGWSLLKPFLNAREKKVLMIVVPLQILDNIAIIVVDEMDPGSVAFAAWGSVLHVVDIIAAGIVLVPIIWSIRHLRQAQEADRDEKTKDTLIRLTQFRSFYLTTMVWLYFTRILVVLMSMTLSIQRQWVAAFFEESATLAYYVWVGYRFRPAADNSDYLRVPNDEDGVPSAADIELAGVAATAAEVSLEDKAEAKASSSSVRVSAPSQSVARPNNNADDQTTAGSTANHQPTANAPVVKKAVAIADDDNDDEFGVDDDDFDFSAHKPVAQTAGGKGSSGGGLKNVKSRVADDDDLL